jgi:hypothetical protein
MKIISGVQHAPTVLTILGQSGGGKTNFASLAPKPLFLDLEKGTNQINCDRLHPVTVEDIKKATAFFIKSEYQTLVVDSVDALESLVTAEILLEKKISKLTDIQFGGGTDLMVTKCKLLLEEMLLSSKNVIFIAHEKTKEYKDLELGSNYDKIVPRIHEKIEHLIISRSDCVFYIKIDSNTVKDKEIQKKSNRRICYTQDLGAYLAKNRLGLEPIIDVTDNKAIELIDKVFKKSVTILTKGVTNEN